MLKIDLDNLVSQKRNYILGAIVVLAVVLIFFNLGRSDIRGDEATYALRAAGYLDTIDSNQQTTPVQWFDDIPIWSRLSFHDSPPLFFILQFVFLSVLGMSETAVRVLPGLAGVGSVILIYFIGKRLYSQRVGLLASFILAISASHAWISRLSYLESTAIFFSLLSILRSKICLEKLIPNIKDS